MNIPRVRPAMVYFFVAVFVLLGGFVAGISAIHYEFALVHAGTHALAPDIPFYAYDSLPAQDQRLVDAAIGGERFVFIGPGPLPGWGRAGVGGRMAVQRGDTVYTFVRQPFFDAFSRNGLVSLALSGSGLLALVTAVRRDMAPRY